MKTLRVTLADIEGAAHASTAAATSVTVSVAYSGQVVLTSGTVIPAAVKSKNLGSSGVVDFSVYASDDPVVRSEYRGFAVVVTATVRGPVGSPTTKLVRSVKPLESMGSVVQLGELPPAEGLPAQWVTVDEVLSDFDARLDSLEDHPANHAARHATGGPDPITPESIGALPADSPKVRDTGWRDITSLADPAVFDFTTTIPGDSYLRWRRIGSTVHLSVRVPLAAGTVGTPASTRRNGLINGSLIALGLPDNRYIATGYVDLSSSSMCSLTNSSTAARLDVHPIVATGNVSSTITARIIGGNVSWLTAAPWPAPLPGTPA